ncbi:MAG: hypothetical protein HKN08_12970, partial [Gammaproteobacteria bacterium]|nr:hypothetical protein [Gammaproteobacteria bacterium]
MSGIFVKKVLLVFGNSHLNAFRRCFDRLINKDEIDFDIHYVVSGLLKIPWGDFRENKYLRHLIYQDNIAPSINITSWRYRVDIVLVGMGM